MHININSLWLFRSHQWLRYLVLHGECINEISKRSNRVNRISAIHEDVSNNNKKKNRIQSTILFDICIPSKLDSQPYGSVHPS